MLDVLYGPSTPWRRGGTSRPEPAATVRLETERLILRELRTEDLSAILAYLQDPVVLQYQNWTQPWTPEQARQELWEVRDHRQRSPRCRYDLAIVLREAGQLIGECGLSLLPPSQSHQRADAATISYMIRRDQWGRGFATEAARTLLMFAFAELDLTSVFGGCHPDNVGSRLVMERLGMTFHGADESFPGSPEGVKSLVFRLEREQWLAQSGPGFDLMQDCAPDRG
jgi:RimJ/RimL family protein N-acetyltransferase